MGTSRIIKSDILLYLIFSIKSLRLVAGEKLEGFFQKAYYRKLQDVTELLVIYTSGYFFSI